jgi:GTP-binding protein
MSKLPIVAIVGRANVGKSSLFNRFLEKRQAIVADKPGTTRDAIYGKVEANHKNFWLVDTAGLKSAEDEFELSIQEQITQAAESADALIVVIEHAVGVTEEDRRVAKMALKSKKPVTLAVNKADDPRLNDIDEFRKLGIKDVFLTSAQHNRGVAELSQHISNQLPKVKDKSKGGLSLSFIGRPNVGKSSLFNTLLTKQKAVVADVAGTTRDVNRQEVSYHSKTIELLDTAGIRRSGKVGKGVEYFSVLRALSAIEESDVCCLVMDANELNTKLDQKIAGMIKEAGKGMIIVVSKWDTIDKDAYTRDDLAREIAREFPFVSWAPLIFTSSETGQNVTKLFELALDIQKKRSQKLETKELNRWLTEITRHHPPAGLKNKHPNLTYMTQVGSHPPRFKVFGRDLKYLHWSYKRYMDKEIRQVLELEGTPVEFEFESNAGRNKKQAP